MAPAQACGDGSPHTLPCFCICCDCRYVNTEMAPAARPPPCQRAKISLCRHSRSPHACVHTQTAGGDGNESLLQQAESFLPDIACRIVIAVQHQSAIRAGKRRIQRSDANPPPAGRADLRAGIVAVYPDEALALCVQHLFQAFIKRSRCIVAQLAG